jgi:mannose-1-phosphate guanylyltransferase
VVATAGAAEVVAVDSPGAVIVPGGRLVAALGAPGVIIVDTPDALLVCGRDRAQDIKRLTEVLRERGAADLL